MAIYVDFPERLKSEAGLIAATRAYAERRGFNWDALSGSQRRGFMVSELRHNAIVYRVIGGHSNPLGRYDSAMRRLPRDDTDYTLTRASALNAIVSIYPWLRTTAARQMA